MKKFNSVCTLPWTLLGVGDWYNWENFLEIYLRNSEWFSHDPMPSADRFVISNGFKLQSPNTTCNSLAQFRTLLSYLSQHQIWKIQLLMHRPEGLQGCWKSWNISRGKIYDVSSLLTQTQSALAQCSVWPAWEWTWPPNHHCKEREMHQNICSGEEKIFQKNPVTKQNLWWVC